jgi:hypothetical protein
MTSGQSNITRVPTSKQRRLHIVLAASRRFPCAASRVLEVIVDALRDEDQVREAEVYCECDDGGDEASPESTREIGDVADEPDGEEGEGYAVCGALGVVFDELGDLMEILAGVGGCRVL